MPNMGRCLLLDAATRRHERSRCPRCCHRRRAAANCRRCSRVCVFVGSYYDLERYSGDPRDLSEAQTYAAFLQAYRDIIGRALSRLARNRFACFVVGEIRDPDGFCRNFVGDTIAAFEAHGARLYNHAVMMLPLASLPMRASSAFNASAKLGTCHQHVLVFYNGLHPNRDVKGLALHNASKALEWY